MVRSRGLTPRRLTSRQGFARPSLLVLCTLALLAGTSTEGANAGTIQPRIARLLEETGPHATTAMDLFDLAAPLETPDGLRLQLVVSPGAATEPGRSALVRQLQALGVRVLSSASSAIDASARVWEIVAPRAAVPGIAANVDVVHLGQRLGARLSPPPPSEVGNGQTPLVGTVADTTSEGVAAMKVPETHALGITGKGVRVGIIDLGFNGYLNDQFDGALPETVHYRSFTGERSDQSHGLACAQIVTDVAPDAELYLAEIASSGELQEAINWLIAEQVEVVSHSLAWFLGGGDGTGPIVDMTKIAASEGIHWVTSAGNYRRAHWNGTVGEVDGDGWVLTGTASGNGVGIESGTAAISLILTWDRWPLSTDVSFQIEVYEGGILRGTSAIDFGDDYPYALRQVTIASANWTNPEFRIRADRGNPEGVRLRVFRVDNQGGLSTDDRAESGSLAIPADSPWVLSVGAYSWRATVVQPFSSYGPTGSGLAKPDLIATDAVSTTVPGYTRFVGTSAACPHVAGAVALLVSAGLEGGAFDLHWSPAEVAGLLSGAAEPLPDVDTAEQGWGRLRLPLAPASAAASPLTLLRSGRNGVTLHLRRASVESPPTLEVFDASGRRVARIAPGPVATWSGGQGIEYALSGAASELRSGRYWVRDPESGAAVPIVWRK